MDIESSLGKCYLSSAASCNSWDWPPLWKSEGSSLIDRHCLVRVLPGSHNDAPPSQGAGATGIRSLHTSPSEFHRARRWHPIFALMVLPPTPNGKWALLIIISSLLEVMYPFCAWTNQGQQSGAGCLGFCRTILKASNSQVSRQTMVCF